MKVDRNDPCPCGSGEKYEKCCMEKDMKEEYSLKPHEIFELAGSVLEKAFRYIKNPLYFEDIEKAEKIFFDYGDDEELDRTLVHPTDYNNFSAWLVCDYKLEEDGMTPIELLLDRKGEELSEDERTMAKKLSMSFLSLYDAVSVVPEEGETTLRNLFTYHAETIIDRAVAQLAGRNVFFALRLLEWEDFIFAVGDLYVYHGELKERILMFLKNRLVDKFALVQPSIISSLKTKGFLFNHLQMQMRQDVPVRRKESAIKEEEELKKKEEERKKQEQKSVVSRSHFMVENYDKVKEFLESSVQTDIEKSEKGETVFTWSRNPGRALTHHNDGKIKLSKRKLIFESTGERDFEDGKTFIRKNLKGYVNYMYDDLEKRRGFARG